MKIGIIGFGRFGKLLTKYLSKDFEVFVFDRKNDVNEIKKAGGIPRTLKEVCSKDIVIPAVPISEFEKVLIKIKNLLQKNSLVVDVCSVKEYPVKLMKRILPKKVQILATHPMFGPDSAADSLKNRKIVLCKIRISDSSYGKITKYLKKKGLVVIEASPRKHDKEIAESQVLTHFIGRCLLNLKIKNLDIDTEGYKRLKKILEVVENDTWQLFEDMNKQNRFSKKVRKDFAKAMKKVGDKLK